MIISVRGLTGGLHRRSQQADASELDLREQEACFTEPVRVDYTLEKIGQQVIFRGVISTSVNMTCSRCLESVQIPISETLTILVRFDAEASPEEIHEEIRIVPPDTGRMDVTEELRQTLLLALPVKPLCKENCRGLCPRCGTNLNAGSCDCRRKTIDPRWSGLKNAVSTSQGEKRGLTKKKDLQIQKR